MEKRLMFISTKEGNSQNWTLNPLNSNPWSSFEFNTYCELVAALGACCAV